MTTSCGFVAIIGEPNAGKSTLINALVWQKIAITTPKPQTTRTNVRGVVIEGRSQIIFIDTPGIFGAEHKFEKAMVKAAWAGAGDADAVLLLVDATKGITEGLEALLSALAPLAKKPIFAVINKLDKVKKERLLELATALSSHKLFREILFISALKSDGLSELKSLLAGLMPQGPFHYPDDEVSDVQLRTLAAEITREKLFFLMAQELPYASLVETEQWDESEGMARISQVVYVQREAHKKMVIGEKGAMIKRIGSSSRRELEKMLGKKVHLELFVKVRAGWKDDRETYRLLNLNE
ncbi:MAG: GTPase Era [Alphaproteobacteria bacterium]|nr:GTPase Era [Alphaproteobacteria bacterium]